MSAKAKNQTTLVEYEEDGENLTLEEALYLATTKYAHDKNVQVWVELWEKGIKPVKTKKKESVGGLKPHSEFAKRGLVKSVRVRENKGVW